MKEFDIYLPPRLTECDVYIYSLPYYSGITVVNGIVIDSSVDGYMLRKLIQSQSGIMLYSEVEGTFKLVHEKAHSGLILASSVDMEAHYKLAPEASGFILSSELDRLSAEGFLRMENGIALESSVVPIQVSKSLGHGESGFIINSSVDGTLKISFLGSDIQSGIVLQTEAAFTPRVLARPIESGIVLDAKPFYGTLEKMTGGSNSIIFDSEADAILSHSLGHMEPGIVLNSSVASM